MKIRHYGIVVDDIKKSLEKYPNKLVQHSTEVWDGKVLNIAKVSDMKSSVHDKPGRCLELIQGDWFDHVCFECDEKEIKEMLSENELVFKKSRPDHDVYFVKTKEEQFIEIYFKKGGM